MSLSCFLSGFSSYPTRMELHNEVTSTSCHPADEESTYSDIRVSKMLPPSAFGSEYNTCSKAVKLKSLDYRTSNPYSEFQTRKSNIYDKLSLRGKSAARKNSVKCSCKNDSLLDKRSDDHDTGSASGSGQYVDLKASLPDSLEETISGKGGDEKCINIATSVDDCVSRQSDVSSNVNDNGVGSGIVDNTGTGDCHNSFQNSMIGEETEHYYTLEKRDITQ